jgi:hypothetical protein
MNAAWPSYIVQIANVSKYGNLGTKREFAQEDVGTGKNEDNPLSHNSDSTPPCMGAVV